MKRTKLRTLQYVGPLHIERWIINGRDMLVFRYASSNKNDTISFMVGTDEIADANGNFFEQDIDITGYVDDEQALREPARQRRL